LDWSQRLQYLRQKAKKINKLTVKEHLQLLDDLVRNNDAKYLEDPRYKELKDRITIIDSAIVDSEGYFDITEHYGSNIFFFKI